MTWSKLLRWRRAEATDGWYRYFERPCWLLACVLVFVYGGFLIAGVHHWERVGWVLLVAVCWTAQAYVVIVLTHNMLVTRIPARVAYARETKRMRAENRAALRRWREESKKEASDGRG